MLALVGMSLVWFQNCLLLFKYENLMFLLALFAFSLCVCVSVCLRITAMYISPMTLFLLFTTQCNRCTEFASSPVGALSVERHNGGLLGVGTSCRDTNPTVLISQPPPIFTWSTREST